MSVTVLVCSRLAVGYQKVPLLSDLDLAVAGGEVLTVRGRNGSGKSTLLRCLAGLLPPLAGRVSVDGQPVDDRDVVFRRSVATLLHAGAWYPNLTCAEHLQLVRLANQTPADWFPVAEIAGALGIDAFADSVPGRLSAGQRQRLALGMVFSRPSRLLLLDEPEQHLDGDGRASIADLVNEYAGRGGAALVATHDPRLADAIATAELALDGTSDEPDDATEPDAHLDTDLDERTDSAAGQ
jgi:ABC-2 type transport system ATP-binding protein